MARASVPPCKRLHREHMVEPGVLEGLHTTGRAQENGDGHPAPLSLESPYGSFTSATSNGGLPQVRLDAMCLRPAARALQECLQAGVIT